MVKKSDLKINSQGNKELEKAQDQFDAFDKQVKEMTHDRMNAAPKQEVEPQTKLSSKQLTNSKEIYLKPLKVISCQEKFNEKYRGDYNFQKEFVRFIAEHKELIGEEIEIWTKPFAGVPAEYWKVPTNKPLWGPRYLAEQIKRKSYHRLTCKEDAKVSEDGTGTWHGQIVVDSTIQRLDALPVTEKKSIFMGASNF